MFDVPLATRRRPMLGISAALHAALGLALFVPPLFATQEPPEPDGFVRIEFVPRLVGDAPVTEKVVFLRRGNGGGAPAPAVRASHVAAPRRPSLSQPPRISE